VTTYSGFLLCCRIWWTIRRDICDEIKTF